MLSIDLFSKWCIQVLTVYRFHLHAAGKQLLLLEKNPVAVSDCRHFDKPVSSFQLHHTMFCHFHCLLSIPACSDISFSTPCGSATKPAAVPPCVHRSHSVPIHTACRYSMRLMLNERVSSAFYPHRCKFISLMHKLMSPVFSFITDSS